MTYLLAITLFHTAISLIAIVAGVVAVAGLLSGVASWFWTNLFLVTAAVTSLTGYVFPPKGVTPAQIVGVLALVILAAVVVAEHRYRLANAWRWIYTAGMVASLYLLVFVGIAQAFQKIDLLKRLAPTQSEPPFVIVQGATLLLFVAIGLAASLRYRPEPTPARLW